MVPRAQLAWLVLAVVTVFLGWRSFTLSVSGETATAVVVRLLEDDVLFTSDFSPAVEFQADGQTYSVQSQNTYRWWNRYLRFPIEREVEVVYDPANPASAEINSWWDIWNETIILGIFTFIAAVVVNAYLIFRRRGQHASMS